MSARTVEAPFIHDPESTMPAEVQARHHELNVAARECYRLRNQADREQRHSLAAAFHECGDVYFLRSLAISAEWEDANP